ncbi:uncharacterized protein EV154DRAFT_488632 [Mucor mucedo]|uniref:uncharacterized protein n=1 Tax=Mucor mucedo TaxID=29922 RepID=UPI002220176F|nr:uncharacterized protein EV154DRAFT_488632 [Mucor mucedo]KAI7865996.1 hypothetical protein EV154DRAFT_488632 [Mucor mucedo]
MECALQLPCQEEHIHFFLIHSVFSLGDIKSTFCWWVNVFSNWCDKIGSSKAGAFVWEVNKIYISNGRRGNESRMCVMQPAAISNNTEQLLFSDSVKDNSRNMPENSGSWFLRVFYSQHLVEEILVTARKK